MKRELDRIAAETHDLLVIGGGIQGVAIAREAARRGLRVALVEQDDFGSATSMNSQRMLHGGVRYLQDLDFARMRRSVLERRAWMLEFPDLVRPVPILLPFLSGTGKPRAAVRIGMTLYDMLTATRNLGLGAEHRIPRHRCLSRAETVAASPVLEGLPVNGAVLFHDALALDTERLTLEVARAAWRNGALLANHARAISLLKESKRVAGAEVRDEIHGTTYEVRARFVVHAGGPWAARALGPRGGTTIGLVRAMALLTRSVDEHHALALPSRRAKRLFFFTPWRGHTLVGVDERPHEGGPDDLRVTRSEIESFLEEINEALPGAGLALSDVRRVFAGLLPVSDKEAAVLAREDRILEDEDGLTRVLGVKYTTAPSLARRMVDRIAAALPARSAGENFGGEEARRAGEGVRTDLDAAELEEIRREDPRWREVLLETPRVEAAHAVLAIRSRMALTLADVAFRRTGLAMLGLPPERALERAAMVAAELLGWDEARRAREIGSIRERFVMGASGQVRLERCRNPGEVPASSRS